MKNMGLCLHIFVVMHSIVHYWDKSWSFGGMALSRKNEDLQISMVAVV